MLQPLLRRTGGAADTRHLAWRRRLYFVQRECSPAPWGARGAILGRAGQGTWLNLSTQNQRNKQSWSLPLPECRSPQAQSRHAALGVKELRPGGQSGRTAGGSHPAAVRTKHPAGRLRAGTTSLPLQRSSSVLIFEFLMQVSRSEGPQLTPLTPRPPMVTCSPTGFSCLSSEVTF